MTISVRCDGEVVVPKPYRIRQTATTKGDIHGAIVGIGLAVSVCTLSQMSSKETSDGVFPIACERCGELAAIPTAPRTHGDEQRAQHAMRCTVCNHGWFVLAQNPPLTLRRKPDRRTMPRDE